MHPLHPLRNDGEAALKPASRVAASYMSFLRRWEHFDRRGGPNRRLKPRHVRLKPARLVSKRSIPHGVNWTLHYRRLAARRRLRAASTHE